MSDTVVLALIGLVAAAVAGVPSTIVAWAAYKQSIINGVKTDKVIETAVKIDTATNGHLSKLTADLAIAAQKITGLEVLIEQLAESKRETAIVQAALLEKAEAAPAVRPEGSVSVPLGRRATDSSDVIVSLRRIEKAPE